MSKQNIIIYLTKDGFDLFESGLPSVMQFLFPPESVRDLEVLNKPQLEIQLTAFIAANKLKSATVLIVLASSVLFEKDISSPDTSMQPEDKIEVQKQEIKHPINDDADKAIQNEDIKKYLDTVPFENVNSKIYQIQNGIKVIATNRDLYDSIKKAFEQEGSEIMAVIPVIKLGKEIDITNGFNQQIAETLYKRIDGYKTDTFPLLDEEEEIQARNQKEKFSTNIKDTNIKRFVGMGAVFVLLVGVLGVMYSQLVAQNAQDEKVAQQAKQKLLQTTNSTVSPTLPPLANSFIPNSTQSAALIQKDKTIEIVAIPPATLSGQLKTSLKNYGFTHVDVKNDTTQTAAKTFILFSQSINQQTRDQVFTLVKTIAPDATTQETIQQQFDITITLAK